MEMLRCFAFFGVRGAIPAFRARKLTLLGIPMTACLVAFAPGASGQGTPISPPPGFGQVPQGTGACTEGKSCADLAPQLIQSAEGPSPLEENLRTLTDTIGGRVTGSVQADHAVAWAVEALRRAGVDEVHTEKFKVAAGWSEGQTRVEVLSPAPFPVRLVSGGWSPPTPDGGITADIVDAGVGDDAAFAKAGGAVKGAILLVHSTPLITYQDLDREYEVNPGIIARARQGGAAAILWMSTRPGLLLYRHTASLDGRIEALPQAIVAREDAERIARFLAAGQSVRMHFEMPNRVSGPVESENVVGEIRGREKPDEFVVLGAHLDSWDLGTGALDNIFCYSP
jgi:carboxypeptidase Q